MNSFRNTARLWYFILPFLVIFFGSLSLAQFIRPLGLPVEAAGLLQRSFVVIFCSWLVIFFIHGLFEVEIFLTFRSFMAKLTSAMTINVVVAVLYFYFQPALSLTPRRFLLLVALLAFIGVMAWVATVRLFLLPRLRQKIYTFRDSPELAAVVTAMQSHDFGRFVFAGVVGEQYSIKSTDYHSSSGILLPDIRTLTDSQIKELHELSSRGVQFYPHRLFYEQLLRRVYIYDLHSAWFLENISYRKRRIYDGIKRCIDIVFGFIIALVFLITFPIIALSIWSTSGRPLFFKQERVGQFGKIFTVYKYRTMRTGTVHTTWTSADDARITKVGKLLRRLRLDELPQCLNIILGNMSLVGPRPEQPHLVKELKTIIPYFDERHVVKPGLTGWAQLHVYAASVEETKHKLEYDLYYVKHRSFLFDLEIILKTIYSLFTWSGR